MKKKPSYNPSGQPIRCAIYARTATVKMSTEDNSIRQQVATCERFAIERGWTVGEDCIFTDSGHSGLNINSALKELMHSAAGNPKPFEVLLSASIDRIARDTCLLIRIQKTLRKYGIEIRIVDPETPA
jgi:DNA invertase Pin-like site-specific DNA recombinase